MDALYLVMFVAHPLAFAIFAQRFRGHYGVAWFVVILALDLAAGLFMDHSIRSNPRWVFDEAYRASLNTPGHMVSLILFTFVPPTIIGLIALFSLPARRSKEVLEGSKSLPVRPTTLISGEGEKVCPQCAETVKVNAKICRFCRHEF